MKIYGPVPSWRLGNSLGIDLVEAPKGKNKICSFDCVYCQLGNKVEKTKKLSSEDVTEEDIGELDKRIKATNPDYITFSGEGEPTLNINLGYAARKIKEITDKPIAVLTNASLISDAKVREGLESCGLVIAKIDAPYQESFEKINRPYKGIFLKDIAEGIKKIKTGVAIQTLLFSSKDITNSDNDSVEGLISIYNDINNVKPIKVFLGTAYRPGDNGISPLAKEELKNIAARITGETGIEAIYYQESKPRRVSGNLSEAEIGKEMINLLKRRPCTKEDISSRFGYKKAPAILSSLEAKGLITSRKMNSKIFYILRGDKK